MTSTPKNKLGSADVATLIRRQITNGSLQLHDKLPSERTLADTHRVARGTIREALNRLEEENFVEIRAGSGTYVTHRPDALSVTAVAVANPLELMDARFALEPHICRLAVLHGRRADFDRLEQLCEHMEANQSNPRAFADADTSFHKALVECTRNGLLIWMIDQITSVRGQDEWTRMRRLTLGNEIIQQYNAQHREILNAIRGREPERAATAMKEHLETARLSLTRAAET